MSGNVSLPSFRIGFGLNIGKASKQTAFIADDCAVAAIAILDNGLAIAVPTNALAPATDINFRRFMLRIPPVIYGLSDFFGSEMGKVTYISNLRGFDPP